MSITFKNRRGQQASSSLKSAVKRVQANTTDELEKGMIKATLLVERNIKINIVKMKIVDTGRELNSVNQEVTKRGPKIRGVIGTNVKDYPIINEFGNSTREPRPAFRNGYKESLKDVKKILSKAQKDAIKKSAK